MRITSALLAALACILCCPAQAQTINADQFLNAKMKETGPLVYGSIATERYKECKHIPVVVGSKKRCKYKTRQVDRRYRAAPVVASTEIVRIDDFQILEAQQKQFPTSMQMKSYRIAHCIPGSYNRTVEETLEVRRGYEFSRNQSVVTNSTVEVKAEAGVKGVAGASASARFSTTLTEGSAKKSSDEKLSRLRVSEQLSFNGPQAIELTFFAYQYAAEIPYQGKVILDGPIKSNSSGIKRASDLLTEDERTVPISGSVLVEDASEAEYRAFPIKNGCAGLQNVSVEPAIEDAPEQIEVDSEMTLASLEALAADRGGFVEIPGLTAAAAFGDKLPKNAPAFPPALSFAGTVDLSGADTEGPTIGPADGISYRVLNMREELRPDASCGYTDIGFAKNRDWMIEEREYQEARDGEIISTWIETEETSGSCSSF